MSCGRHHRKTSRPSAPLDCYVSSFDELDNGAQYTAVSSLAGDAPLFLDIHDAPFRTTLIFSYLEFADAGSPLKSRLAVFCEDMELPTRLHQRLDEP